MVNVWVQGSIAITKPIDFQVFDLFWKTPPPSDAVVGQRYPIEVTAINPPPYDVSLAVIATTGYGNISLTWDDMLGHYAGEVTVPSCGGFYSHLALPQQWIDWPPSIGTDVVGEPVLVDLTDSWVYFDPTSAPQPKNIDFTFSCPNTMSYTWTVEKAPCWLRFRSLTGTMALLGFPWAKTMPVG